jgi:hypothetical protein
MDPRLLIRKVAAELDGQLLSLVIAAVVAFFIFTQGDLGGGSNIDVNVDAPAGSSAPAPAAPAAPAAPSGQ